MLDTIKASVAKGMLGKLAGDHDTKTTILGIAAAGLLTSNIDWGKLFNRDGTEIGKAAGALVVAAIGYYTNKKDAPKTP